MSIPLLDVSTAVQILKSGGIIAYPTETVYGVGGDATKLEVVEKVFELKSRESRKPISVLIESADKLPLYVREIPEISKTLIENFWPGPLTLVFWVKEGVFPNELLGGGKKIALRVSSNPLAQKLVKGLGSPLTTTSANLSGDLPAHSAQEVQNCFDVQTLLSINLERGQRIDKLDGIVDGGALALSKGSTILDVTVDPPKLIREGEIPWNKI